VAFHPFSQDLYVDVVREWIGKLTEKLGVKLEWTDAARQEAILWSQKKGDRSGRIAYQFACDWVGRRLMERRG
jgi:predicted AAA+ superfamily ATPase